MTPGEKEDLLWTIVSVVALIVGLGGVWLLG